MRDEKLTVNKLKGILHFQNLIIEYSKSTNTKLNYSYQRNLKSFKKWSESFDEEIADKRLELALTDSNGAVVTDEKGGFKYSKENLKKLTNFIKDLYSTKEKEFQYFQVSFDQLTQEQKDTFITANEDGSYIYKENIEDEEKEVLNIIISGLPN